MTEQIIRQEKDEWGNLIGITNLNQKYLIAVYNQNTNQMEQRNPPVLIPPTTQPIQQNTQQMGYCPSYGGQVEPMVKVACDLDALGNEITAGSAIVNIVDTNSTQQNNGCDNNAYTVIETTNQVVFEQQRAIGIEAWNVKSGLGNILTLLSKDLTIQLSSPIDIITTKWLTAIVDGNKSISPKILNNELNDILVKELNSNFTAIAIDNLVNDYNQIVEVFKDIPEEKLIFNKVIKSFLAKNNRSKYEIGDEIVYEDYSKVVTFVDTGVCDELVNINTLDVLTVPNESSLRRALDNNKIVSCYIRYSNKTFVYADGNILIHHVVID